MGLLIGVVVGMLVGFVAGLMYAKTIKQVLSDKVDA